MAEGSDLVNCHFSVNQQALMSAIKPMMSELAQEWGFESRIGALEKSQVMLQKEVALKAEAAGLQGMRKELQEQRQQLISKSSQSALATMQAQLRSLESTLSWKADQSALEEQVRSIQVAAKQADSKAEQSSLNRVLALAQKLQGQASQTEKLVQEMQGRLQKLEMHNLPNHVQRMADQIGKNRGQLQKLQEGVSSKVDARDLEALANATKELQTAVALKVGPQPLQEIRAAVRDLQLKLDLKVDVPVAEDLHAALNRVQSQLSQKAPAQEFREALTTLNSLRANLEAKADFALLSDLRVKVTTLEACLDKKMENKEIPELAWLKEAVVQKAERRQMQELSCSIERLQQELRFSLENDRTSFRRDVEAQVERLDALERELQTATVLLESVTSKIDATPRLESPRACDSPQGEPKEGLSEVFQLLQGKVDRYELKDQLAEHQATVRQLSDLEKQLKGAKDALLLKVDREEIEELLNSAAEAAAAGITSIHDTNSSDPLTTTAEPMELEVFPTVLSPRPTSGDDVKSLKDAPGQQSETIMALPTRDSSSNSGHTTPRMKGSASAPTARLMKLSAALPRHTRSGSLGTGRAKVHRTGLPAYPAKGPVLP